MREGSNLASEQERGMATRAATAMPARPLPPEARPGYGRAQGRGAMKILLIEDDQEAAEYLVKALTESGYVVDHASEGRDGLFLATSGSYDALIVDRML